MTEFRILGKKKIISGFDEIIDKLYYNNATRFKLHYKHKKENLDIEVEFKNKNLEEQENDQ